MSAVHKQWWLALDLQVDTPVIQILEPVVARVHGRPSVAAVAARATSRQPISSTRREPSAFETIGRAPRLCKECRRPGHDVHNCPVLRPLMGGIRKAETEVVRIKVRRRDKGGEGGRSKSGGWEDQPPLVKSPSLSPLSSLLSPSIPYFSGISKLRKFY
jgi:hypothetical protein